MQINRLDNVDINLENGHKYALTDIKKGENIIKYGNAIGHATEDIKKGEHVHTHNVKTNLSGNTSFSTLLSVRDKYFPVLVSRNVKPQT